MSEISNNSYLKFLKSIGISSFLHNLPNNYYNLCKNYISDKKKSLISEIKNLNEFELFIKESANIDFKKFSNKPVINDGNKDSDIMFISDMPRIEDEQIGKPFQGEVGILLEKMLVSISLKKKNIYLANFFPWRPLKPANISNQDIIKFLPYMQKQIEIIKPKIIMLFGPITAKAILNSNLDFATLRGNWYNYESINLNKAIPCLVSYHPNDLINQTKYKKFSWEDLKKFQKKILNEN